MPGRESVVGDSLMGEGANLPEKKDLPDRQTLPAGVASVDQALVEPVAIDVPVGLRPPLAPPVASPSSPPPGWPASTQTQSPTINVTTNIGGPTIVFTHQHTGPGFFIRALWYLFIGWWASALAIVIAYFAMFTIIGIPLAFFVINRLPTVLTLRPRTQRYSSRVDDGITYVELGHERQRSWWQRAIYFLLVGWWFGAVWLSLAWFIGLLVITLPLSFWMYNRVSGVMTLQRH